MVRAAQAKRLIHRWWGPASSEVGPAFTGAYHKSSSIGHNPPFRDARSGLAIFGAPPLAPVKGAVPEARATSPAPAALILDSAHPGNWLAVMGCRSNPHSKMWEWGCSGLKGWTLGVMARWLCPVAIESLAQGFDAALFEIANFAVDGTFQLVMLYPHGADFHLQAQAL